MKKRILAIVILSAFMLGVAGCGIKEPRVDLTAFRLGRISESNYTENARADVSARVDDYYSFAAGMLKRSFADNAMIAPAPAYSAFGMVLCGAAGNTLGEMENVMGGKESVGVFNRALRQLVAENTQKTTAALANSMWIRDAYAQYVKDDFLDLAANYYSPEIYSLPFDDNAIDAINGWANDNTKGKIKRVLEELKEDSEMVLVSALYVCGKWENQAEITNKADFFNRDGTVSSADYFGGESSLFVTKNAMAIRRYLEGGWYFLAALPNESLSIKEYAENFSAAELKGLINGMDRERAARYTIPEFEKESTVDLVPVMQKMGTNDAFDPRVSDVSDMTSNPKGLVVGSAEQKAKIKVDKNGLEGAATVTIVMNDATAMPPAETVYLNFNRPFVYFVCAPGGVPVLGGIVTSL